MLLLVLVLSLVAGYVLYKYASLRVRSRHKAKYAMHKTVFKNTAKLRPHHINTPVSFKKGEAFEGYIREYLFTKDRFDILHRTPSYATNKIDCNIEDTEKPDFKFRAIGTGEVFWVEAKYRSRYREDKVKCYKPDQLKRYKEFDKKFPVYITLGLGGAPYSPDQVYFIPVKDIQYSYPKLFRSFLERYEVPNDKPIDYERLQ
jgi:hypothetical protein